LRREIDEIDYELTQLFERRMDVVLKISEIKKNMNLEIYDKDREREIIDRCQKHLRKDDYKYLLKDFLYCIMDISKKLQRDNREGKGL